MAVAVVSSIAKAALRAWCALTSAQSEARRGPHWQGLHTAPVDGGDSILCSTSSEEVAETVALFDGLLIS
jgi:hypothetical protein